MKSKENYEQLQFQSTINTVSQENFPVDFPIHWHKYVEMLTIPEAEDEAVSGVIRLNQEEYEIHPGDILFVWPGQLHEIVNNQEHKLIALQFPISALTENRDFARFMNWYRNCEYLEFQKNPELNQTMSFLLEQIFTISERAERMFKEVEMKICLLEMFMTLGKELNLSAKEGKETENNRDKIENKMQEICYYIQENCDTNITLETVAEYAGFSPCYLSRCFKRESSYSFVEYLMLQRVKKMQMFLTDMELSITDAAYQAGFRSISTLNRVFRQYSGCSPREYRKYYMGNSEKTSW